MGDFFSAADGGVREGRPIYMRVRAIQSPMPGRIALYAEMRHYGPSGELYRQGAYLFDVNSTMPIVMQALTFDDASAAAALVEDPAIWVKNNLASKPALVDGCDTRCRIESKTIITMKSVGQLERGYDIDGKLLFGNAGGELYIWPRVR